MTWDEIGRDSLEAAKLLREAGRHRSSVSRAYYAAHYAMTKFFLDNGYTLPPRRNTPPHLRQARLIALHPGGLSRKQQQVAREVLSRLYNRRIDADYDRRVTIDRTTALESIRDVHDLFKLIGITP